MSVGKKLAINSIIQVVGRIFSVLIGLVTLKVLTNYLGVEEFGQYTIVVTFLSMFAIISDLGLNVVMTTEISKEDYRPTDFIVQNLVGLRIVTGLLIWILWAPILWFGFGYTSEVKLLIIFGSLAMICMSIGQVLNGIFIKHLHAEVIAIGDMLSRLVFVLGVVTLWAVYDLTLTLVIGAFVVSVLAQFLYTILSAKRFAQIGLAGDISYWQYSLKEALPLFMIITFNLIYYKIDTIMISLIQGPVDTGLYGVAYKVIEMFSTFPTMFVTLLLPFFTQYFVKNRAYFQQVASKGLALLLGAMLPVAVGGVILSREVVLILSSEEYLPIVFSMQILFASLIWIALSNLFSHMLIGANHKMKILGVSVAGAVFNVALNLVLIPIYSYTGAALATFATEFLVVCLYFIQVRKHVQILPSISFTNLYKIGAATLAMAGTLLITGSIPIVLQMILGAAVFCGVMYLAYKKEGLKQTFLVQDLESAD